MSATSRFSFVGRTALVTGAGGGLGREYCLQLASRGCKVVVNDLNREAADKLVKTIEANGGKAVADYNSVEEGESLVKTAINNFNQIDIVINNAGILRDKSILKMSDSDWDSVHGVHLRGSFLVTRAAWPHMRERSFGRIIMTSSSSGLFGNFGQSNYAAAKMGLIGLSNTLAIEGARYNINSNVIVPVAASQMTANIIPDELMRKIGPAHVAPLVAYLCHERCRESGGWFEASGGWVARYKLSRSRGKLLGAGMTLEDLEQSWDELNAMDENERETISDQIKSATDHFVSLAKTLENSSS